MRQITDRDWWRVASAAIAAALLAFAAGAARSQEPEIKDAQRATGYKRPTQEQRHAAYARDRVRNGARVAMAAKMLAPPAKFDCVEMGWVPPVRDQGSCGSCYLVSTADQATCTWIKAGYGKNDDSFKISDQFGMDCHNFGGCGGGWGYEVAEYMRDHGFPAEYYIDASGKKVNDYPSYQARSMSCREKPGAKRWKIAEIGLCSASANRAATVLEIKTCLMQYGVINIAFNASSAYSNPGANVITVKGPANHETTLTGWDDSRKCWITRGNWGVQLGVKGYVFMSWESQFEDPFWMTATPLPPAPPDPNPPGPGPVPPGQFFITPSTVTIAPKATQQFTMTPPALVWVAIDGGTITQEGLYTAPDKPGTYSILAVSSKPAGMATATITVSNTPPPPVGPQIVIGPDVKPGTYVLLKPGFEIAPAGTLAELERIKAAVNALLPAPKTEPKTEEPPIEQPKIEAPAVEAEPPPLPIPPLETPSQREKYDPTTGERDPKTGKLKKKQ